MHPMGVQIQQGVFVDQNAPAPGGIHYGQIPVMNSFSGDSGESLDDFDQCAPFDLFFISKAFLLAHIYTQPCRTTFIWTWNNE